MAQLNDLLVLGKANIKGSIKANSDHDFLCHSNEFTFASPKYSGDIYVNYRTASGSTDGAISCDTELPMKGSDPYRMRHY